MTIEVVPAMIWKCSAGHAHRTEDAARKCERKAERFGATIVERIIRRIGRLEYVHFLRRERKLSNHAVCRKLRRRGVNFDMYLNWRDHDMRALARDVAPYREWLIALCELPQGGA